MRGTGCRRIATLLVMLGCVAPIASRAADAQARSFLADLPSELLESLTQLEGPPLSSLPPEAQLDTVFRLGTPFLLEAGPLKVLTDARWFSTLPPSGEGAPLMVLRRWPGDSVLALYAVRGPLATSSGSLPPIQDCQLTVQPGSTPSASEWRGTIETVAGDRPAIWIEQGVEGAPAYLGALLLPGDAGFGAPGVADLTLELRSVLRRIEIREQSWRVKRGVANGVPIAVPFTAEVPGDSNEQQSPWQVARGRDFTIGLPPGVRARRLGEGLFPGPPVPGGLLWFRGRFVDIEGTEVALGDGLRAGYVAEIRPLDAAWSEGKTPPLGAPSARIASSQPFDLVAQRTSAVSSTAERWAEEGFSGEWLVFRMLFKDHGLEIGMPVLAGRRSPSLFWIAPTWRPSDRAPAPPPVDPAERFGIRFDQLSRGGKARQPWTEGYLRVPGMIVELPRGWLPAASLRSSDGYPVRLLATSGRQLGQLSRLEADALPDVAAPDSGWTEDPSRKGQRKGATFKRPDGSRLIRTREGHAFLFESRIEDPAKREFWERMLQSIQLVRSEP